MDKVWSHRPKQHKMAKLHLMAKNQKLCIKLGLLHFSHHYMGLSPLVIMANASLLQVQILRDQFNLSRRKV